MRQVPRMKGKPDSVLLLIIPRKHDIFQWIGGPEVNWLRAILGALALLAPSLANGSEIGFMGVAAEDPPDDSHWSTVGEPEELTFSVHALTTYKGNLVAGGEFLWISGRRVNSIAAWTGTTWEPFGPGVEHGGCPGIPCYPRVLALLPFGDDLIVGGNFIKAGGQPANYIARWDGSSWHPLGEGVDNQVFALAEFQGQVVAGGLFLNAGGQPANHIARWDGVSWHPLNEGLNDDVKELLPFDGRLITCGYFSVAGQTPASRIAAWDGAAWLGLGAGSEAGVSALGVFDDQLLAAGRFRDAVTSATFRLGRWDGENWVQFGSAVWQSTVALTVYRGRLIRGFTGDPYFVERWDGAEWHPLGSGTNGPVRALYPTETSLFVGGDFLSAGGKTAWFIARWDDVITPVYVEELTAASEENAVRIEWRLSRDAAWSLREIAVERAAMRPGPYQELARLFPAFDPTMNFTDTGASLEESQWYRLRLTSNDGSEALVGPVEGRANGWSTVLDQPVDSAADGPVEIRYRIAASTPVRLEIFAPTGQLLRVLQQGVASPGAYISRWDRRTESGSAVARGMYFVRLATDREQTARKLIVLHR
jgi:hypothetical protein